MASLETLNRTPAIPAIATSKHRQPASAPGALVDYVLPRAVRKDPTVRVLEMDRVLLVESHATVPAPPCTALVTENMLVVVLEGQKRIEAEGAVSILDPEHAVFLRRGHYGMAATLSEHTGRYRCATFFFDDAFLGEFAHQESLLGGDRSSGAAPAWTLPVPVSPALRASIEALRPYFEHAGPNRPRILRLKLQEILLNLLDADPAGRLAGFLLDIVADKRNILGPLVEAHLGRPVTIEELARQAGMSLSAFKREFRGAFGASPREWLTDRRLDRARHLLARADRNVTEVGLEVGFESVSHFIHRFRRRFAVTPKQFQMSQTRQNQSRPR
jgi:AraC-like DNA-binding protein